MNAYDAQFGGRPVEPYPGRRQSDELTAEELRAHPVWWFPPPDGHLTGPDACTVMPADASAAMDGVCELPDGRWLLHAVFTLADGSTVDGHVSYATGERTDAATQEPTLCTPGGQVPLWHGSVVPDAGAIGRWLALLAKPREAVFPLTWRAAIRPSTTEIAGSAAGFLVWRDGRIDTV